MISDRSSSNLREPNQANLPGLLELHEIERAATKQTEKHDVTTPAPAESKTYDYVFIGAGATGGAATAKLTDLFSQSAALRKKGFSVLLLEGGVDKKSVLEPIPVEHPMASEDKNLLADPNRTGSGTGYWVRQYADDIQAHKDPKARADGMVWKPRGEGFGGSTRMNAQVFVRIDDKDWDSLALTTGDPAFRSARMRPLLEEVTKVEYRPVLKFLDTVGNTMHWNALKNIGGHGFHGPLEITRADPRLLLGDLQLAEVAVKGLGWSLTHLGSPLEKVKRFVSALDPNDNLAQGTEGPLLMPTTISAEGRRTSARDIIFGARQRHRDSLTLQDGARVSKVLLNDNHKVTGVLYTDPEGKPHEIKVGREAIIATGALESAALLMRSGIGPKNELDKLKSVGVDPKIILDGVGKRQGFRYEVGVVEHMKKPLASLLQMQHGRNTPDDPVFKKWQDGKGGLLSTNGAILSWQSRSKPDLKESDLFVFALPGKFEGYIPGYSKTGIADANLLTFVILNKNKGESNGTLELNPKNPTGAPIIDYHFHDERKKGDSAPLVAGIKQVRDLVKSQLGDLIDGEVWPGPAVKTDAQLAEKVNNESWDHHPRGGAQLGSASDLHSVVDSDFKVIGTTGLRVIDASVLPNNIGDFIVSGLYQVGLLAAQKIAVEAEHGPKPAQSFNSLALRTLDLPKTLREAQALTRKSADAAEAHGMINHHQHQAIIDGTVSTLDMDLSWKAINTVLEHGERVGGDQHTIAHNLLLSVAWQLDRQGHMATLDQGIKDRMLHFFGRR